MVKNNSITPVLILNVVFNVCEIFKFLRKITEVRLTQRGRTNMVNKYRIYVTLS